MLLYLIMIMMCFYLLAYTRLTIRFRKLVSDHVAFHPYQGHSELPTDCPTSRRLHYKVLITLTDRGGWLQARKKPKLFLKNNDLLTPGFLTCTCQLPQKMLKNIPHKIFILHKIFFLLKQDRHRGAELIRNMSKQLGD